MTINMTSSRSVSACLQRNVTRRYPASFPKIARHIQACPTSRPRVGVSRILGQQRAFSLSIPRRLATFEDDFDPKSVDRESDRVDVCIIGGGKTWLVLQVGN